MAPISSVSHYISCLQVQYVRHPLQLQQISPLSLQLLAPLPVQPLPEMAMQMEQCASFLLSTNLWHTMNALQLIAVVDSPGVLLQPIMTSLPPGVSVRVGQAQVNLLHVTLLHWLKIKYRGNATKCMARDKLSHNIARLKITTNVNYSSDASNCLLLAF